MSAESISGPDLDSSVNTSKLTAAVFFWAAWDGASRASMPTFEQVANANSYGLSFYKYDIDSDQATTAKFGIRSVPTVQLFKGGQVVSQISGTPTRAKLDALVANA
jgi:thioredoxin 1